MNRKNWKLMVAGALVACVSGAITLQFAWATPPSAGFTATNIVGATVFTDIATKAETDDWKAEIKFKGPTDVYVTHIRLVPGAHGGWHSHPGPSFISVKSGTATLYDDCIDPTIPYDFPAGTAFVEDAGCVHLLVNEGDVDCEVVVIQFVPRGAPRRINENAP